MAHEIYINELQEHFKAYDGKPAWHILGDVETEDKTFREAIEDVVRKKTYTLEPMGAFSGKTGMWEQVGDKRISVMRDPENLIEPIRSFGQVAKDYTIINPYRFAELVGPVLEDYRVQTAGILRNGASIFVAMKVGNRDVVGEDHKDYLTFDIAYDPGTKMKVYLTTVRTVCANTQEAGIKNASINLQIGHSGKLDNKIILSTEIVKGIDKGQELFTTLMESYARYSVTPKEIDTIINATHKKPARPKFLSQTLDKMSDAEVAALSENSAIEELIEDFSKQERAWMNTVARSEHRHELVRGAFAQFNSDFPEHRGTAYAIYNAVTQVADWRDAKGNGLGASVINGTRQGEKARAAKLITAMVE